MRIRELDPEDRNDLLKILQAAGVFERNDIEVRGELNYESPGPATSRNFSNAAERECEPCDVCRRKKPCTAAAYDLYWIAAHAGFPDRDAGKGLTEFARQRGRQEGGRLLLTECCSLPKRAATRKSRAGMGTRQMTVIPDFYSPGDDKVIYGKNFLSQADCDPL